MWYSQRQVEKGKDRAVIFNRFAYAGKPLLKEHMYGVILYVYIK